MPIGSQRPVPERNRKVKKLLETTYGKGTVRVSAGNGTAYHWMDITFLSRPQAFDGLGYGEQIGALVKLIEDAGLHVARYTGDGDYEGVCISLRMPQAVRA